MRDETETPAEDPKKEAPERDVRPDETAPEKSDDAYTFSDWAAI